MSKMLIFTELRSYGVKESRSALPAVALAKEGRNEGMKECFACRSLGEGREEWRSALPAVALAKEGRNEGVNCLP